MVNWELVAFVKRGEQRIRLLPLLKQPLTASELAQKSSLRLTHAARALREFKNKGLIECLNPKDKVGKMYRITKLGRNVLTQLEKMKE